MKRWAKIAASGWGSANEIRRNKDAVVFEPRLHMTNPPAQTVKARIKAQRMKRRHGY